ncbi:sensor histidine kinase [Kutzneria viridogrisea]|uniref:Anti-sigma regulatory factor (Ser/Thr protein kinase) n=1 Tax=Kutzneria viridogrisea TaxID=47990 RepID=A0ABR6BBQ0_9PSEU|nr:anti-sigma regulatory factor (Ser/Thr protein kinase) [Kutzneria viridogrisea]
MASSAFQHSAFLYDGADQFCDGVLSFVRSGLGADEAVLVAVTEDKAAPLRAELGADAERVCFVDMAEVGRNPARIIPAWRDWVGEHTGVRGFRGVGEPAWPGRSAEELTECAHHESLLNLVFDGLASWQLMCPYDVSGLDPEVIDTALANHPYLAAEVNTGYREPEPLALLAQSLPEPTGPVEQYRFDAGRLAGARQVVVRLATEAGARQELAEDLALAVHEAAMNSVDHGGGQGVLRIWQDGGQLVCEVRDSGWLTDPLVGRARPTLGQARGRGMWMIHQLCDLVQLRSSERDGTLVRLRVTTDVQPHP